MANAEPSPQYATFWAKTRLASGLATSGDGRIKHHRGDRCCLATLRPASGTCVGPVPRAGSQVATFVKTALAAHRLQTVYEKHRKTHPGAPARAWWPLEADSGTSPGCGWGKSPRDTIPSGRR
jgi:hypothetical protein